LSIFLYNKEEEEGREGGREGGKRRRMRGEGFTSIHLS